MSKDPRFIENQNSRVNICCKQVSLWDTSRVAALLMKTSVICYDCNIQVRRYWDLKPEQNQGFYISTDHGDLERRRNRVYSTQGSRFWCPSP